MSKRIPKPTTSSSKEPPIEETLRKPVLAPIPKTPRMPKRFKEEGTMRLQSSIEQEKLKRAIEESSKEEVAARLESEASKAQIASETSKAQTSSEDRKAKIPSEHTKARVIGAETVVPQQIDNYEILGPLGAGGMGVVYKAQDKNLHRLAAIKLIQRGTSEIVLKRFYKEMEVSANLKHPNIVKIYNVGEINQMPYMAMEFIEGVTLLEYFNRNTLRLNQKLAIIEKVAQALDYAHKQKVIHRDIKPSNIMVRPDGEPVLMDFGLAKTNEVSDRSLTRSGEVIGTPQYMSPEQAQGLKREVDALTDVYGLGAVLYHILVGTPPAKGETLMEILYCVTGKKPAPPRSLVSGIPQSVENICLKAIEKEKKKRYQSALDFANDIHNYLHKKRTIADKFYNQRKIIGGLSKVARVFGVLILVCGIYLIYLAIQSSRKKESEVDHLLQIQQHYQKGRSATSLETAYIEFTAAIDILETLPPLKKEMPAYPVLLKQLNYALLENYYEQGQKKASDHPEEAVIYFSRAMEILQTFPKQGREIALKMDFGEIQNLWRVKLCGAFIRSSFRTGNYRMVYQTSIQYPQLQDDTEIAAMVSCAAYYCNEEDALDRFKDLAKRTGSEGEKHIGSLYYQGMIHFYKKSYEEAKACFKTALELSNSRIFGFTRALYFYYLASIFSDLHRTLDEASIKYCASLISKISALISSPEQAGLYPIEPVEKGMSIETIARYLLALIQTISKQKEAGIHPLEVVLDQKPETIESLAKRVVESMDGCIQENMENAEYYYIRGKAYMYLQKYKEAMADFTQASHLEPTQIEYFLEKFSLLPLYAEPEQFQYYDEEMVRNHGEIRRVQIALFLPEFARLCKEQLKTKFSTSRGMEFSEASFERFYKNLYSSSSEIQNIAQASIVSMHPSTKIVETLNNKMKNASAKEQKIIEKLRKKIEEGSKKVEEQNLLTKLSQVDAYGRMSATALKYFERHSDVLKKILDDDEGKLCMVDKELWVFMRFLAARVLVYLQNAEIRTYLFRKYLDPGSTAAISSKILAGRALYETGLIFFDKTFLADYSKTGQNEFLQAITAETLSPVDALSIQALQNLLNGLTDRVKVSAALQLALYLKHIPNYNQLLPNVIEVILEGYKSKYEEVRALSVLALWNENLSPEMAQKYLPFLVEALQDRSHTVQKAAFSRLVLLRTNYNLDPQSLIPIVRNILATTTSSLIRNQTIMALGSLGDINGLKDIGFDPERPLMERISAFTGLGWRVDRYDDQQMQQMALGVKKIFNKDPSKHVRGYLLYSMCRYSHSFQRVQKVAENAPVELLKTFLESSGYQSLNDPDPILCFYALIGIPHLPSHSQRIIKKYQNLLETHPVSTIRIMSISGLITMLYKKKSPDLEKWHQWVKAQKDKNYYWSAVLGYHKIIQERVECGPIRCEELKWDTQLIRYHEMSKLRRETVVIRGAGDMFANCLERILDLTEAIPDKTPREQELEKDYICKLATLYDWLGHTDKALDFLEKMCVRYEWKDASMTLLWSELAIQSGKEDQALQKLQNLLQVLPPMETAKIKRGLAQNYLRRKNYEEAKKFSYEQYIIAPRDPLALICVGDYHCRKGDYETASTAFLEAIFRCYYMGEAYCGLARLHAQKEDIGNAVLFIRWAHWANYLMRPKQLDEFPEFQKIKDRPELKNEIRSWIQRQ